jgi:hypothetical protein
MGAEMTEDETGYTEIPDGWIQQFKTAVAGDPTASSAWSDIKNAGLEEGALLLLWGFAGGATPDFTAMHRRAEDANDRLKAAIREQQTAETTTPKRAHDPDLFHRRATMAHETAMRSAWPVPTAQIPTLGDELAEVEREKGGQPPLLAVRKALTKAAGKRSPLNSFYFLFLLQGYAAKYGVELGVKRLVALAYCADPDTKLDEGTLGRYLRTMPKSLKESILHDALPALPQPSKP